MSCFNPSVGILFVHTSRVGWFADDIRQFQSLGRDSVCSYEICAFLYISAVTVSIPRSGFCLFILVPNLASQKFPVCFNPSVGILFVHTRSAGQP